MRWPWARRATLEQLSADYSVICQTNLDLLKQVYDFKKERDAAYHHDVQSSRAHAREFKRLNMIGNLVKDYRARSATYGSDPVVPCAELEPLLAERDGDGRQ